MAIGDLYGNCAKTFLGPNETFPKTSLGSPKTVKKFSSYYLYGVGSKLIFEISNFIIESMDSNFTNY